jgi:hypothetical protein
LNNYNLKNIFSNNLYSDEEITANLTRTNIETKNKKLFSNIIFDRKNLTSKHHASETENSSLKDLKSDKNNRKNRYKLQIKKESKKENRDFIDPKLDVMFVPSSLGSSHSYQFFKKDSKTSRTPRDRPITQGYRRITTPITEYEMQRPGTGYNNNFRTSRDWYVKTLFLLFFLKFTQLIKSYRKNSNRKSLPSAMSTSRSKTNNKLFTPFSNSFKDIYEKPKAVTKRYTDLKINIKSKSKQIKIARKDLWDKLNLF